jgi:hypothetical protein
MPERSDRHSAEFRTRQLDKGALGPSISPSRCEQPSQPSLRFSGSCGGPVSLRKFASSLRVFRVLLWSDRCVRCCSRARLNRLAVDPHSFEFAAIDRGGPWVDPKFHQTPSFRSGRVPKISVERLACGAWRGQRKHQRRQRNPGLEPRKGYLSEMQVRVGSRVESSSAADHQARSKSITACAGEEHEARSSRRHRS